MRFKVKITCEFSDEQDFEIIEMNLTNPDWVMVRKAIKKMIDNTSFISKRTCLNIKVEDISNV